MRIADALCLVDLVSVRPVGVSERPQLDVIVVHHYIFEVAAERAVHDRVHGILRVHALPAGTVMRDHHCWALVLSQLDAQPFHGLAMLGQRGQRAQLVIVVAVLLRDLAIVVHHVLDR